MSVWKSFNQSKMLALSLLENYCSASTVKTSYLLEGWHLFEEAKASGADILQVFVLEEMADRVANIAKVKLVSPEVLKELCETQTPQGIVAEVAKQSKSLPESLSGEVPFYWRMFRILAMLEHDSHSRCRRL